MDVLHAATESQAGNRLVGDLASIPDPACRLIDHHIHTFMWMRPYAGLGPERDTLEQLIIDRTDMLRSELAHSSPFLDKLLQTRVNHQLRSRPDYMSGKLAIEQWVPALRCWLVNGYYDPATPASKIIADLQAGDPTKRTAEEELAERREKAEARRKSNEASSTDKLLGIISNMTDGQVKQFVEVERALQTGEQITARGDDYNTIDALVETTKSAADRGDVESQQVLERGGQFDHPTLILPTTNPFRHRHRSELEQPEQRGG